MASTASRSRHAGIQVWHRSGCASRTDRNCNCRPTYRAEVWSARDEKKIRKTFTSLVEAKAWRADALGELRRGSLRAPSATTLAEVADAWLAGAGDGSIRNRSGDVYKPSAVRGYEQALRLRVVPKLGKSKLADIQRGQLQGLVDELLRAGHQPSTIRNTLLPVRAIFRRAVARGEIALNPTTGLELPAVRGTRDRIAGPEEAAALLAALPRDRAIWATAMYAGLRHGELRALRVEDIDLAAGLIRVERSWDPKVGPVAPKSRAGRRVVPIAAALRAVLAEHLLALEWNKGLAFGRAADVPLNSEPVNTRAYKVWKKAGLDRITLHECRHTFASLMIAAGVNAKALSTYMGHSSVTITFDRYGHLMPGNEQEAAGLLDDFLRRAQGL
jgi:integrase